MLENMTKEASLKC